MTLTKRLLTVPLLLGLCGVPSLLFAQATTTIPTEHPSVYKGVRPVGMGNAFVAMPGQDENAMFYNPASINDFPKAYHFRFVSPLVDFSPGAIGLASDLFDLADNIDAQATDAGKIDTFRAFVNQHTGQFESIQARVPVVSVYHKWFGASILADSRSTISFRNRAFTNVEVMSRSDFGGVIGSAYNFKDVLGIDENFQIGVAVKVLHRLSIDEIVTTDDVINTADFGDTLPRRRATGVGADIGLKGDLPTFGQKWLEAVKPTLGFTWQDIGNTRFGNNVPDTEQSISVGFALHPKIGDWQLNFANDFRELNQSSSFLKKWNIGAEAVGPLFWNFFRPSVRIGGNQGYFAAGTSLDFKFVKLEFATYGEEAGKFTTQKQLRRLAVNLSFGFDTTKEDEMPPPPAEAVSPAPEPAPAPAARKRRGKRKADAGTHQFSLRDLTEVEVFEVPGHVHEKAAGVVTVNKPVVEGDV